MIAQFARYIVFRSTNTHDILLGHFINRVSISFGNRIIKKERDYRIGKNMPIKTGKYQVIDPVCCYGVFPSYRPIMFPSVSKKIE